MTGMSWIDVVAGWLPGRAHAKLHAIAAASAGEPMPSAAPLFGLLLAVAGAAVLAVWIARAVSRRGDHDERPAPAETAPRDDLLTVAPWLSENRVETLPIPTRSHRAPRPRSRFISHPPSGQDAISLIRERRSRWALHNEHFLAYLRGDGG